MWILQDGFHTSLRHGCSRERGRRRKELWDIKLSGTSSGSWRGDMLYSWAVGNFLLLKFLAESYFVIQMHILNTFIRNTDHS